MITEDYVSFETAKLLKEKGFDIWGDGSYDSGIEIYKEYSPSGLLNSCAASKPHSKGYPAPTLQMVMKWLRNIHGLFIHIDVIREASCWLADIQDIKGDVNIYPVKNEFPNYEEACEAAIKYCLKNLI